MADLVKEANACYARAEKALKTGLLKWSPDNEIAANEYNKAATAFRNARMPDKFIEATLKAAVCYENSRSFFSAAKAYEQVGLASKEKGDWDSMVTYFEKACLYFREHGVPDTAALTYNRGASMLETVKPEKSAEWYGHASETVLLEDRYLQAAEYANKAVRMYLKLKQYDNAIEWCERALENYNTGNETRSAGRQISTMIIIHLARDDHIAAQKVYMANKGLVEHDERYVLDNLFNGFDNFDNAAIHGALKTPFIQNLENEVTKIVRDLLIKYEPKKSAQVSDSRGGGGDVAAHGDEDDEAGAML